MKRKTLDERRRIALAETFNRLWLDERKQYKASEPSGTISMVRDSAAYWSPKQLAWRVLLAYASQPKSSPARRRARMEIACAEAMK